MFTFLGAPVSGDHAPVGRGRLPFPPPRWEKRPPSQRRLPEPVVREVLDERLLGSHGYFGGAWEPGGCAWLG